MKKLSMEIMYVPRATVSQKKEMVMEWRTESENVFRYSVVSAAVSFMSMLVFLFGKEGFWYIYAGSSVISLLCGYMAKRWSIVGYWGVIISVLLNCLWFSVGFPEGFMYIGSVVIAGVCSLIPCFSAIRCICNYTEVFLPLKESKGFPDFIMNTADLYGDKIYLKNKPEDISENDKYQASYNPFKNEEEMDDEEFRRSQELKARNLNEPITMNIGEDGRIVESREPQSYKYGKAVGGFEIEFLHNDFDNMSFQERAMLMSKWRGNIALAEKNFYMFFVFMAMSCMAGGFGDFLGTVMRYLVLVLFAFGISRMKIGYTSGAILTLAAVAYSFCMVNSVLALVFVIGAYVCNFGIIISPIRFLINKRIYNRLSTMEGFPTFIRTTADLYGSQMYITEERPRVEKKMGKDHFITMNIGYDEPKKPEEGKAWNAFDYMDEENKEKENND